jgi:SAM-dependent methyltransferase
MTHANPTPAAPPSGAFDSHNLRKWDYGSPLYQRVLGRYLDSVYRLIAGAGDVLDAGCGEGFVYRGLKARGFEGRWRGVDVSNGAIAFARDRSPEASWAVGDLYGLAEEDGGYELVLCSQVLEHLRSPERVLAELTRVSRRWLLVSVPYEPVFRVITALSVAVTIGRDPGHVNFWTPSAFRSFLRPAGRLVLWMRSSVYQIALVDTGVWR